MKTLNIFGQGSFDQNNSIQLLVGKAVSIWKDFAALNANKYN